MKALRVVVSVLVGGSLFAAGYGFARSQSVVAELGNRPVSLLTLGLRVASASYPGTQVTLEGSKLVVQRFVSAPPHGPGQSFDCDAELRRTREMLGVVEKRERGTNQTVITRSSFSTLFLAAEEPESSSSALKRRDAIDAATQVRVVRSGVSAGAPPTACQGPLLPPG